MVALPWLALSVLGGHTGTSNAASESEGCHSIAQLIMSDLQTSMGDDIHQMTASVCLRDGKEDVEQLRAIYPDEAKSAASASELDITAQFKVS
jgi:hypothetical protein